MCNNKKDDLVMMHALARFEEQLGELDQAEERLHAALETMLAADTDMHTLTAAITTATGEAKAQLAAIREHNERAARGTRRRVLDNVLVGDVSQTRGQTCAIGHAQHAYGSL